MEKKLISCPGFITLIKQFQVKNVNWSYTEHGS